MLSNSLYYQNKYVRILAPFIGFFSGGILYVATSDLYNFYFKNIYYNKRISLKRLNNLSAYLGFTLGLSFAYRGKPLLMK
tara:strand:+ start:567 stop:806 length:240 start_codon:yes stop_codon:yes gene_type:complete